MGVKGTKVGHLWIQDCAVKECEKEGRWHYHTLNPRGKVMKEMEQTVWRTLKIIEAFDEIVEQHGKDGDWTVVNPATYRKIFGSFNPNTTMLPELWKRYKDGTLQRTVLGLAENLVLMNLTPEKRKEIQNGLKRVRKTLAS